MRITRNPARGSSGSPVYTPDSLPVYRGGGVGGDPRYLSDFVNGNYVTNGMSKALSDQYTVTRATKAWDIDNGVLEEYAVNEPIVNSKGVWADEGATNEVTLSNDQQSWIGTAATGAAATSIGDSLGLSATRFVNTGAANTNKNRPSGSFSSGKETSYFILENIDAASSVVYVFDATAGAEVGYATFDWATKTATPTTGAAGTGATADAKLISSSGPNGGEVYLISVTVTPNNSGNLRVVYIYPTGFAANSNSIICHHAQHTETEYAHPPILTDATAVTKDADIIVNNTAIAPWYNQSEGTIFVQSNTYAKSGEAVAAQFDDGTANDRHVIKYDLAASPDELDAQTFDGGVSQALITLSSADSVDGNRTAYSYELNDFEAATDGASTGTDASGTLPTVDTLRIGCDSAGNYLGGYIQKIEYYPTRLPQATLEAITAPTPCLITYDVTSGELAGLGAVAPTYSDSGATATTTLTGDPLNTVATNTGLTIPVASGYPVVDVSNTNIISYELQLTLPAISAPTANPVIEVKPQITAPLEATTSSASVKYDPATGLWGIYNPFTSSLIIALGASGSFGIAVDLDIANDLTYVTYNSIEYSYASTLLGSATPIIHVLQTTYTNTGATRAADVGLEVVSTLIQKSTGFTLTHHAGAMGLCSQTVVNP